MSEAWVWRWWCYPLLSFVTPRGHTEKGDEVEVGGDSFVGMRLRSDEWCSAVEVDGSDAVVIIYCVRRMWRWK